MTGETHLHEFNLFYFFFFAVIQLCVDSTDEQHPTTVADCKPTKVFPGVFARECGGIAVKVHWMAGWMG